MAFKREKTVAAAQKAVRKGNLDRAIKEFKLLVEDDPSDKRTRLKMADIYVKLSKLDEALGEYRIVAKQYADEDFHEKAAAIYKQALRIAPEDATLHQYLGSAYFQYGRSKDALRSFSKAERIYKEQGNTSAHLSILEKMVDVDPDNVGIQIQLAERCEKNGLRDRAIQYFLNAGEQLQNEGRIDEFVQVSERLVFLAPEQRDVRKVLIKIYHGRSDNRRALRHLQVCFKTDPEEVETLELLGATFHRLNENAKSVLVYKQLAQILKADPARVREVYQTILRIDSSDKEAIKILGISETKVAPAPIPFLEVPEEVSLETDSLAGVMFLDDDDFEEDHLAENTSIIEKDRLTDNAQHQNNDFLDFAEDAMQGFDDFDLDDIEEIPTFRGNDKAPKPVADIAFLDVDPELDAPPSISNINLEPILSDFDVEGVNEILAEAEVFIKYNLLDQAKDVLQKAIDLAPNEPGPREQLAGVLIKKNEVNDAARQMVELARIFVQLKDPAKANEHVRKALNLCANPDVVRAFIDICGISDDVFFAGPKTTTSPSGVPAIREAQLAHGFDDAPTGASYQPLPRSPSPSETFEASINKSLDEISTGFLDIEQDPALTGSSEIITDAQEITNDELLAIDLDVELDDLLTIDSDILSLEADDDMFDLLFETSQTNPHLNAVPPDIKQDDLASEENVFGNVSLTNAFQSINVANDASFGEYINTHIELGSTYVQMSLYEEAIEEFKQALNDPEAVEDATLQIALCQIELGDPNSAKENFRLLLNNPNTSPENRQSASEHLSKF